MAHRYAKLSLVGSGSYGNVWIVNENDPASKKAMKEVKLYSEKDVNQAIEEVSALSRCKHDNIIRYYEAFVDKENDVLSIIMEYATEGDLDKHIKERKGVHFPNDVISNWFTQLLMALSYIHKRGILHRDIKPQNIFVDKNYVLKLGDFGICRILQREADLALTMIGTPFYLSPEICLQQPYNCKSDMWSAGCVLYELCCLQVPFTAANIPSLTANIIAGFYKPLPSHCDRKLTDAVRNLLVADPEQRPSASELLKSADFQIPKDNNRRPRTPVQERLTPKGRKRQAGTPLKIDDGPEWAKREYCGPECFKIGSPCESPLSQGVDGKTYTIVRYPKLRHLSPASPELSQLLERQRSMSGMSNVSSPRTGQPSDVPLVRPQQPRQKQEACLPRLNLLQAIKEMTPQTPHYKTEECETSCKEIEMDLAAMEHIMDIVTPFKKSASSSHIEKALQEIKRQMLSLLEPRKLALVLNAVRDGTKYSLLREQFSLGPNITQIVLWYSMLQEFL